MLKVLMMEAESRNPRARHVSPGASVNGFHQDHFTILPFLVPAFTQVRWVLPASGALGPAALSLKLESG